MDFGLILPTMPLGANREGIQAAADAAERLGWHSVWATDHVLVDPAGPSDYHHIFEAIVTLAYLAGRTERIRLGTSVIVVPQRNAVVVAKELASLDALSRGRVIAGVGGGWYETEFRLLGVGPHFRTRGARLDEALRLWRHLWSGGTGPFEGRFHSFGDVTFGPLPPQGGGLPIWTGGQSEPALRRAGALADGYHSSGSGPAQLAARIPIIAAAAATAGRPMPRLSARVGVTFGPVQAERYRMAGTPDQMLSEIEAFAALGVSHLAVGFDETDAGRATELVERFDREVVQPARERLSVGATAS
ncbi:MAG: TIGR03619 family F420-dependent LLM class oxidoreductase [Chloroflexi bacterium]|nr:TIGR03619 family F420-dependent LLM class oxidoreductase [Chloroflexota bacterium]